MAAGHSHEVSPDQHLTPVPSPTDAASDPGDAGASAADAPQPLEPWLRDLQQACRLEAERGFPNLIGRQDTFANFVARNLEMPAAAVPHELRAPLPALVGEFRTYATADLPRRQALVRQLRQLLHRIRERSRPELPVSPPRLRLAELAATSPGDPAALSAGGRRAEQIGRAHV